MIPIGVDLFVEIFEFPLVSIFLRRDFDVELIFQVCDFGVEMKPCLQEGLL